MTSDNPLPQAKYEGSFTIFGVNLKCAVLDDGRRVFEAESMEKLFEAMADPNTPEQNEEVLMEFAKWCKGG